MNRFTIETKRLKLICCDEEILRAIIAGDNNLSELLNLKIAPEWSFGGEPAFRFSLDQLTTNPENKSWLTYLVIFKKENKVIGAGGYKGKPTGDGMVEIGYGIAPTYQNKNFATEMAEALIQFAFSSAEVNLVMAHTLAEENASVHVLRKCGLHYTGEVMDPED